MGIVFNNNIILDQGNFVTFQSYTNTLCSVVHSAFDIMIIKSPSSDMLARGYGFDDFGNACMTTVFDRDVPREVKLEDGDIVGMYEDRYVVTTLNKTEVCLVCLTNCQFPNVILAKNLSKEQLLNIRFVVTPRDTSGYFFPGNSDHIYKTKFDIVNDEGVKFTYER